MTQWIIIGCIILLFGAVVFRGAPYVPTLRRSVNNALDILDLEKGDLIVDLGSGDGAVLKAAAARGWRALGYEINPLLCLVARIRCLPYAKLVNVRWRDFWLADMPQDAKAVFVFLAGPHMPHLARKLTAIMQNRTEPLKVLSYGFAIPGYLPKKISNGLFLYELEPGKVHSHEPEWNPPRK
ncbi:MAG TPA: hypothetical protein VLA88_01880 [Candidatus Saccharimonadales bacterium]|nr:hypothetical protein [Candidatus Saccharimonadales bacterium]